MENITIFFCDIYGTYKTNICETKEQINNNTKEFLNNLEKIRTATNSDKLVFSFISTDYEDTVYNQYYFLNSFNENPNIILGIQFFENGYIEKEIPYYTKTKGKINKMLLYLYRLEKKYNINTIYFADDTEFYHYCLKDICNDSQITADIQSIIPKHNRGLSELNKLLEEKIKNEQIKIKKI